MAIRYGHIGQAAQRQAMDALNRAGFQGDGAQNWAQLHGVNPSVETVWNWHTFRLMVFFLKCLLLPQDGARLVKRRRALLESNSPRNNQLETHRDDEPEGGSWVAPRCFYLAHRTDRSPHA